MKSLNTWVSAFLLTFPLSVGCSAGVDDGPPLGTGGSFTTAGGSLGAPGTPTGGMAVGTPTTAGSSTGGTGVSAAGAPGQAGSAAQQGGGSGTGNGGGGAGPVPTDGKGLYDANCKACHGEQGVGTPLAPETQHPVREYSNWVVRNGRAQTTFLKPMEKWGPDKLSDPQLTLIWDYLDLPPQPTTGKALYNDYCANCHGADGKGGPTMRNIVNEVQNVLKQVRAGKNIGQYAMRHDSMPVFNAMRISDAELNLIHDYVDSF